jgi:hypothetical protein
MQSSHRNGDDDLLLQDAHVTGTGRIEWTTRGRNDYKVLLCNSSAAGRSSCIVLTVDETVGVH